MILITGGLGFVGLHTARALLDLGESCVLTQHRTTREPAFIAAEIGRRIFIEQLDVTDQAAFLEIGKRHSITGIVHLAAAGMGTMPILDDVGLNVQGLLNALRATLDWGVARISIASTIGVYGYQGENRLREDMPLSLVDTYPIPAVKKTFELLSTLVAGRAGFEVVNLRLPAMWGPLGRPDSPFFATPGLVHAAVRGATVSGADPARQIYAEDGIDMCYVKDAARGIALLQTSEALHHPTYNVGWGRATTNRQIASAIKTVIPEARIELQEGYDPRGSGHAPYLDITRLREDTAFEPAYDEERAVTDYVNWLRSGNER